MRTLLVVSGLAALLPGQDGPATVAAFRTQRLFGDHMVLPRSTKVPLSGFGAPGSDVVVRASWGGQASAKVSAESRWRCDLETPAAPGPFEVTLRSGTAEVVLHDVLVGDVWLGSGQSNMEMQVGKQNWSGGVLDWQREVAAADLPQLRVFTVAPRTSGVPLDDVDGVWQVSSPATAGAFSASAFFFGRELVQRGKGPIGLVVSSWGGTVCEAWASEAGLSAFPEFGEALAASKTPKVPLAEQRAAFWRAVPSTPASDAAATEATVPDVWSQSGLSDFDGVVFYSREVTLPPALVGRELALDLGAIDDMDTVWCNGVRVGGQEVEGAWEKPRHYRVPAAATKDATVARLLVRVVDSGGEGRFGAAAADLQLGGVSLAGAWQRRAGPALRDLPAWPRGEDGNPNRPAVLWNAMVAPLAPFPFTGAIWYQGESNRGRHEQYARLFPAMIADWRRAFARELPFYFVQIAPFAYNGDEPDELTPLLREAQAAALGLPHTGMVVTLDVGDARDIHPRDKQSVGKRLALLALRDHYGEKVASEGPRVQRVARDGSALRIVFDNCEAGLAADATVGGFELAGEDGAFVAATCKLDGASVVLAADAVVLPQHVRYAWSAVPAATLRNGAGLPCAPFRMALPH